MIASPCKTCENRYLPKDICSVNCEKIRLLQGFLKTVASDPYMAVDCTDSSRYTLSIPVSNNIYS